MWLEYNCVLRPYGKDRAQKFSLYISEHGARTKRKCFSRRPTHLYFFQEEKSDRSCCGRTIQRNESLYFASYLIRLNWSQMRLKQMKDIEINSFDAESNSPSLDSSRHR